jgi:hypothetical protein
MDYGQQDGNSVLNGNCSDVPPIATGRTANAWTIGMLHDPDW